MLWTALALALAVLLVVAIVCLVVPLEIGVRAPESGDLVRVKLRHAALSVDVWLPLDVVIHWIAGIAKPPPVSGHVFGVPLSDRTLAPVADGVASAISGFRSPKPEPPPEPKAPGRLDVWKKRAIAAAPGAAWDNIPRFRKAVAIDVLALDLDYGTGDPVTTGMIAGYLWQLAAVLPEPCYIRAEANWLEPMLRVEGEARVRIFPWRTIHAVLCLALAIVRAAWTASRAQPPTRQEPKETQSWPRIRTETPEAEAAPPSSPS